MYEKTYKIDFHVRGHAGEKDYEDYVFVTDFSERAARKTFYSTFSKEKHVISKIRRTV